MLACFVVFYLQKYSQDKGKVIICLAFSDAGDVVTGDSNGNIHVWGKGNLRRTDELRHEKTWLPVSDQVQHKCSCPIKRDGKRLEISDLDRRGFVSSPEPKAHGELIVYQSTRRLCVHIFKHEYL